MSLKLEYQLKVVEPKQKHLESLVAQVFAHCKDKIDGCNELPYVIRLDDANIDSTHDLTSALVEVGVESNACFITGYYDSIEVTVTNFI